MKHHKLFVSNVPHNWYFGQLSANMHSFCEILPAPGVTLTTVFSDLQRDSEFWDIPVISARHQRHDNFCNHRIRVVQNNNLKKTIQMKKTRVLKLSRAKTSESKSTQYIIQLRIYSAGSMLSKTKLAATGTKQSPKRSTRFKPAISESDGM